MTREQLQRELCYRAAMSIAKELLNSRMVNDDEYIKINKHLIRYYQPIIFGLYP